MSGMNHEQRRKYHRTEVWMDAVDLKVIETLKTRYAKLIPNVGTISTTVVIRRALRQLDRHLKTLTTTRTRLAEVASMAEVINSR